MKKESIFFKINLLFIIALLATIIAFSFVLKNQKQHEHREENFKLRVILKDIRHNNTVANDTLDFLNADIIEGEKKRIILNNGYIRKTIMRHPRASIKVRIITYAKKHYYLIKNFEKSFLISFKNEGKYYFYIVIFFIAIIAFLILIYLLIRKSLMPLKNLEKDIKNYSNGLDLEPKYLDSKDEVAKINNAFYSYAQKASTLTKSRELFIRNIFHELNTPVTKGKILAEITQDNKTKQMLESIFNRLDSLLKELAQMEQISSKSYTLNIQKIPIIELIDSAKELLYLDSVEHNITQEYINCDYKSMVLVFKKLMDNAIKYGSNLSVEYKNGSICFLSKGKKLEKSLEYYTQEFTSQNSGFGLGLYIVKEILQMHSMDLKYSYRDGLNIFCIEINRA